MDWTIRFKGKEWFLVGDKSGGAITTPEAYRAGEISFAHLYPDGRIFQFNECIGTIDDIEFIEPMEVEPTLDTALSDVPWTEEQHDLLYGGTI